MESREVHIKHLLDIGAVKDWNREDAIKTGAKILSGRFVDDAHKEKSRWCAEEFATCKDSSVFAAASDVDNTSLISLLPVKRDHGILCFDAVTASGQVPETELIFIEATCRAQSKSWSTRIVAMPESERRQTERSESVARSLRGDTAIEGVPRSFQAEPEVPDDLLLEPVRDCFRPACRRRLRDRTGREDDGCVRMSRDQNYFETPVCPSSESETRSNMLVL